MSTAAASAPNNFSSDSKWTTLTGPLKGTSQELTKSMVIIGRSSDCDVVINDPKCSRKHAKVEVTAEGFVLEVLSESNALKVNGSDVQTTTITDGDVISIGDTDIRFNTTNTKFRTSSSGPKQASTIAAPAGWTPQVVSVPVPPPSAAIPYEYGTQITNAAAPKLRRKKPKANYTRFYIYGGIILVGFWLFSGGPKKGKKEITIRGQEQIDKDIEVARKLQEDAEELRRRRNQNPTNEMRQAQENYVKGFRDFRKGQYERALESFQACLSLAPEHVLCNRYLRLSQRKFNELIQYHMVLGRKYRDQEQYRACRAAFRNVTTMVADPTNPIYKEAKLNFEACNSSVEGSF